MQLGLPSRDYFLHPDSDRDLEAYHNYMTDVAVILGAQPAQAAEQLWEVIQFKIILQLLSLTFDQSEVFSNESISILC